MSGTLPAGVVASVGIGDASNIISFSGAAEEKGTFTSVWRAVDENGWYADLSPVTYVITDRTAVAVNSIPSTQIAGAFDYVEASPVVKATANNVYGKAVWSAEGLPAGLSINPDTGSIIGRVINSSDQKAHSVVVKVTDEKDGASATQTLQLTVNSPFAVGSYSPATLKQNIAMTPAGFVVTERATGASYSQGDLSVSLLSGALPPGISVGVVSGLVQFSGTPTTIGTYTPSLKLTASSGWSMTLPTVTFSVIQRPQMVITSASLINVGATYVYPTTNPVRGFGVTNLSGTASWSASNLPTGLEIEEATGRIVGSIPETAAGEQGLRTITVSVVDSSDGARASANVQMQVNSPMGYLNFVAADLKRNVATDSSFNIRGPGNTPYRNKGLTVSIVSGSMPPGVSIVSVPSSEVVAFIGKPTTLGTYPISLKVTDLNGWTMTLPTITFKVTN
jgi:hypothetical protein